MFLKRSYIARISTCGRKIIPHISPIYYANDRNSIFFATETTTKKYRDLLENPVSSIVVDDFYADWVNKGKRNGTITRTRAVVVTGKSVIYSDGKDRTYSRMYAKLFQKYPDYRKQKWKKGESPIVRVLAERIVSWGI